MGQCDGVEPSSCQLSIDFLRVDVFSPFHFKRFSFLPTTLGDIEPFVGKRSAHAAKHAAINQITDGRFHHAPRRRRGKKHRLLRSEQRLELWMNGAVKLFKVVAAMSNQRTRKRRPGFFGNLNRPGNKKLVVRMHGETFNNQRPSAKLRRSKHPKPTLKVDGCFPPRPACGERIEVRGFGKGLRQASKPRCSRDR